MNRSACERQRGRPSHRWCCVNHPGVAKNERQPHTRPMRRSDTIRRAMPCAQGRWKKPFAGCMAAPRAAARPRASGMGIGDTGASHVRPSPSGWQRGTCCDRLVTHSRRLPGRRCCDGLRVRDEHNRCKNPVRVIVFQCNSDRTNEPAADAVEFAQR